PLATLAQTARLIAEAGRDNAIVCVDPLHLVRAGEGPADISRHSRTLFPYAQISDGVLAPGEPDPARLGRMGHGTRRLRGEGSLPLREILRALPSGLPLSVEGPPPDGENVSARAWAKRVLERTREFLAA